MIRRCQLLLIMCGFILVIGLTLWPGRWSPPAYASVTLSKFTATTVPGHPEIVVEWETATELDTSGFYVDRSGSSAGPYARVSDFIIAEGSTVVGAQYRFTDTITVFNHTYYYRLEVVNNDQSIDYHGPISVTVGPAPNTPTLTPTRQPATEVVDPTGTQVAATPRLATGSTITPRPTSTSVSSRLVTASATPTPSVVVKGLQSPTLFAGSVSSVSNASEAATVAPPPAVQAALAPALTPTTAIVAANEPVVIVTEGAPSAASMNSTNSAALALIVAAILFLALAFVILRQVRQ